MPQAPQLSPKVLTVGLVTVTLTTLLILTALVFHYGRPTELALPVSVQSGKFPVPLPGGAAEILADAVRVTNLSEHPIANLSITVNKEFHLYRDSPLAVGEVLVVPLEIFKTKANHPYRPATMRVWEINVYGQLPSGARGVVDYEPVEEGQNVVSPT